MAKFQKGNPGKPKGAVNKASRTVKETVLAVFNSLQDDKEHNLLAFAKDQPVEFYKIAARLIPTEVSAQVDANVTTFNVGFKKKEDEGE